MLSKKIIKKFISVLLTICVVLPVLPAYAAKDEISVVLDGTTLVFDVPPMLINDRTMVPMRAIYEALGCSVEWDEATETITAVRDGITMTMQIGNNIFSCGDTVITLDVPPTIVDDRTLVPVRAISEGLGCAVEWNEDTQTVVITSDGESRGASSSAAPTAVSKNASVMNDTYIGDDYRFTDAGEEYNGLWVYGHKVISLNTITNEAALDYASVLNTVSAALSNVNMYSIIIPTSDEFYAPKEQYGDQLSGIKTVYENLNDTVTAVNTVKPLWEHAGEKIYFDTDHHWTQRGSYYAYSAFKEAKGETAPALDSYEYDTAEGFLGSFATKLSGTPAYDILAANPDQVERWYPKAEATGTTYYDQDMQKVQYENMSAVNKKYNNYSAFLGGDCPIMKFTTSAGTGKKLIVVKESYGNAFTVWNMDDYDEVYVIDIRRFNGNDGNDEPLSLTYLCEKLGIDDVVVITYPPMLSYYTGRHLLEKMI